MIVFADTSALLKFYVDEVQSAELRAAFKSATAVAAVRIAWAEAHAALARRAREHPRDARAVATVRKQLAKDWPRYAVVEITQSLVERAGNYAEAFALRSYDSVQLAAAAELQARLDEPVAFACFDSRLCKAAAILSLQVLFAG